MFLSSLRIPNFNVTLNTDGIFFKSHFLIALKYFFFFIYIHTKFNKVELVDYF